MNTWHLVSDADGTILGVFPEGQLSIAQEFARRTEAQSGKVAVCFVHTIGLTGKPPELGQSVSMTGDVHRVIPGDGEIDAVNGRMVYRRTGKPYVTQFIHGTED